MSGVLGSPSQLITTLDEEGLQELYTWIDEINLSRPKRNIWRDFSDGGRYHTLSFISVLHESFYNWLELVKFYNF